LAFLEECRDGVESHTDGLALRLRVVAVWGAELVVSGSCPCTWNERTNTNSSEDEILYNGSKLGNKTHEEWARWVVGFNGGSRGPS
jgi:hypothetical protein